MKTLLHIGTSSLALPEHAWDVVNLPDAGREWPVSPDVVVFDPDVGRAHLLEARLQHPTVPRVVLAGADEPYDLERARLAYAYLTQSANPERMNWLLHDALGEQALPRSRHLLEVADLPVLPANATRLLDALDDPEIRLRDATDLIASDPGLAARVLALANSAFYGLPRRVGRLQDAAGFLGLATLRRTVLATQVFRAFESVEDQAFVQRVRDFSVLRMNVARSLTGSPNEEVATAALLMDVGRLAQRSMCQTPVASLFPGSAELDEEAARCGLDSGMLAAIILDDWGMPSSIVHSVASAWWARPHAASGLGTAAVLRIASGLASEGLGEGERLSAGWLEALGVHNRIDGWRQHAADLAIQWPAA